MRRATPCPLLLAVWSEATRNPVLADLADEIMAALRQQITRLFERWEAPDGTC